MRFLHISFHKGCQNDMQYICNKLNINLDFMEFDDGITKTNAKYNIGHERANNCWNKYKDYFNSFDGVITSDTAPISRVFLQNNYSKKLIIWICNRFDYYDGASLDCNFPDQEYYELIKSAIHRPNVSIFGYTAPAKGSVIKVVYDNFNETKIDNKSSLFCIPQYHNETIMMNLSNKLNQLNIPNYNGRYNGPCDLAQFKGVIHIPYAWSNLALFEALQLGIIYFIPSFDFLEKIRSGLNFFWSPPFNKDLLSLSEWYDPNHKNIFVYFDSWDDLVCKTNNLNYNEFKDNLNKFAKEHHDKYLESWRQILV